MHYSIIFLFSLIFQNCINKLNTENNNLKILFLGESTSLGQGASSPEKSYIPLTIEALSKTGINFDYRVIAKRGMSSSWGVLQLNQIQSYLPDLTIIEFNINDQYLSNDTINMNYNLFSKIPYGEIVIFDLYDKNNYNKYKNEINPIRIYKESTRWKKIIDTKNKVPNNWEDYLFDGTHPNDPGYAVLAGILTEELKPILQEVWVIKKIVNK